MSDVWLSADGYRDPDDNLALLVGAAQARVTAKSGDSIKVADGELNNTFTVQQNDSSIVTIPVNFTYAGLGAAGRSLLNTGAVNYHVQGGVTVGSPIGSVTVPYSTRGRFTTTGAAR